MYELSPTNAILFVFLYPNIPAYMTTLYLVRHGETVDNAAHLMQGQTQGRLNAVGFRQAEELCERFRLLHVDAFVASDLRRAMETCEVIAAPHGIKVQTTPLLRERNWGDFTGRYIPDLKDLPFPENVESLEEMKHRARQFLEVMCERYPNQTVLAVGHGIINKAIQSVFYHRPMREIERMNNAEVRVLVLHK